MGRLLGPSLEGGAHDELLGARGVVEWKLWHYARTDGRGGGGGGDVPPHALCLLFASEIIIAVAAAAAAQSRSIERHPFGSPLVDGRAGEGSGLRMDPWEKWGGGGIPSIIATLGRLSHPGRALVACRSPPSSYLSR
jgi:hypothetical protein